MTDKDKAKRRRVLTLLAGLAGFAVVSRVALGSLQDRVEDFEFADLDTPQGYRRLKPKGASFSVDPFVGLGGLQTEFPVVAIDDPTAALFYNGLDEARVPVAYFTDLYCPYCRVLGAKLIGIANEGGIKLHWHETPVFGQASVLAAKAQIAAGFQGQYEDYHKALAATPVRVSEPYVTGIAQKFGLDLALFKQDLTSARTLHALGRAQSLAALFGLIGTPAMIIGRTLVVGDITPAALRQLIALES